MDKSNPISSMDVENEDSGSKSISCPPRPILRKKSNRLGSRKTSAIWDHFRLIECGDKTRAVCIYCEKSYAYESKIHGTSTLWAHLNNQCKEYPYRVVKASQKGSSSSSGCRSESPRVKGFDVEEIRKELARYVILDEVPFRAIEKKGFRNYSYALEPRFVVPSRITVARDCLKVYEEEKLKLKSVLKTERLCLTTDCWTSIQNLNYMCLTAHWIDSEWNLHKRILNFCQVHNHKGETIGKMVETCLLDWGIDRIFTLTVDNASSNHGAIRYLKRETKEWRGTILEHEFLHVRCCAHILNLVVKDGLDELDQSIVKIRNAIRYVRSSPSKSHIFKMCAEKVKIESKSLLCLDIETRWNSTYKMLEVAEKFEKAFARLIEEDPHYVSYFDKKNNIGPPTREDWDTARVFVKFLRLFYTVTLRFSGSLYVTSNSFFHELMALIDRLGSLMGSGESLLHSMAVQMKKKLEKYWENDANMNFLLFAAVVLDPRYKMEYVRYCFGQVYDESKAMEMGDKVYDAFVRIYAYYLTSESTNIIGLGTCISSSQVSDDMNLDATEEDQVISFQYKYSRHRKQKENLESNSEVVKYLAETCEEIHEKFDILGWWKINGSKYPYLSQLARDVLAIPVSTVASESAFSTGGRILDPFRSALSPLMVEALVCCQNWLDSTPIDLREAMDNVETYEEVESDFPNLRALSIRE